MFYSLIIPVYNRPDEVDELLSSLERQTYKRFEVIIVEDGSDLTCRHIVDKYIPALPVHYFFKPNSGPGMSRNYGAVHSTGDFLIFLDSDCLVPENYLREVEKALSGCGADAFGGPDRAAETFSNTQKAINYSMTSFLTTGGIRGGKKKLDKFYPRSFNLGVGKKPFEHIGGFSPMRFGEDIDFSFRLMENGYNCMLFPNAWVYHKRRTDLKKFFKQVYNSGSARISLCSKHPGTLKLVHMLPMLFTLGITCLLIAFIFSWYAIFPILLFSLIILADATMHTRKIGVGLLSICTSFVQLVGYGCGFAAGCWKLYILKDNNLSAFDKTFYN